MASRITVFSKEGYEIGDLSAATIRSYTNAASGVIGQCEWNMSRLDEKTSLTYLEYGKYVLIRHDTLPTWVGIIYPPRQWGNGFVRIRAYQAEKILELRPTPHVKILGRPDELFRQIIELTNSITGNEKPIALGTMDTSDTRIFEEEIADNAYSHIHAMAEASQHDFEIVPVIDAGGKLSLQANWYGIKAFETGLTLYEVQDFEVSDQLLLEQGDLFNDITGYSDATTEGTRLTYRATNAESLARYGYYGTSFVYGNVTEQAKLETGVLTDLARTAHPEKVLNLTVIRDEAGTVYPSLRIGAMYNINLSRAGFSGNGFGMSIKIRVLGMEVDDLTEGKVKIVSELQNA